MAPEKVPPQPLRCLFLNLGPQHISFDPAHLAIESVDTVEQIYERIDQTGPDNLCIVVGVSRNLMTHYLAVSGLFFSPRTGGAPVVLVNHSSHHVPEHKAFLYGKRPYPISRITSSFLTDATEVRHYNLRTFHRIPVEFVAFAVSANGGEPIPVVCKNISWGGTYFETREKIDQSDFRLLLRSRLHRIEVPARFVRRRLLTEPTVRDGYGVRFPIPLPLTLIHYMYAKYMKDSFGIN